jgi:hypothetical protein
VPLEKKECWITVDADCGVLWWCLGKNDLFAECGVGEKKNPLTLVEVRGWTKFPLVRRYYPHQQVSINRAKYKNNPQGIFAIAPTILFTTR